MTYEFLILIAVRDADIGPASLIDNLEREVLDIGLECKVIELATDETLSIENTTKKLRSRQSPKWNDKQKKKDITYCEGS